MVNIIVHIVYLKFLQALWLNMTHFVFEYGHVPNVGFCPCTVRVLKSYIIVTFLHSPHLWVSFCITFLLSCAPF